MSASCVRLLINLERVGEGMFEFDKPGGRDVLFLGQSDDGITTLCEHLGWMVSKGFYFAFIAEICFDWLSHSTEARPDASIS